MAGNIITSYGTLQTAIQDFLARSDLTDANFLPEIIQAGENRLYNGFVDNKGVYFPGLRIRQMEKNLPVGGITTITIVGGTNYAAGDTIAATAAPAGGVTATGILTVTAGVITGFTLTNPGLLYTTAPTWTITTSTGSGGSITCTITTNNTGATISPSGNIAVPQDYLDLKYMIVTTSGGITVRMQRKTAEWIYEYYPDRTADNVPAYIGRDNANFIFGPFPDSAYTASGVYYYRDTSLSDTYTSNWIINSNPVNFSSLLLSACLAEAGQFIRDMPQQEFWEGRYQALARSVQAANDREQVSGSPMLMATG